MFARTETQSHMDMDLCTGLGGDLPCTMHDAHFQLLPRTKWSDALTVIAPHSDDDNLDAEAIVSGE